MVHNTARRVFDALHAALHLGADVLLTLSPAAALVLLVALLIFTDA